MKTDENMGNHARWQQVYQPVFWTLPMHNTTSRVDGLKNETRRKMFFPANVYNLLLVVCMGSHLLSSAVSMTYYEGIYA